MSDLNTPSNFDLEQSIAAWRAHLPPADAGELESHLRDGIARFSSLGLTEEESFLLSARRLGDPSALAMELAKADPLRQWRMQLIWIAVGYVGTHVIGALAVTASLIALRLGLAAGVYTPLLSLAQPVIYCTLIVAAVFLLFRSASNSHGQTSATGRGSWINRSREYYSAHPARCMRLVVGIFVLNALVNLSQFAGAGWRITQMAPIAIENMVMSVALPAYVMLRAMREQKAMDETA
jgi:hypothetical protein